MSGRRLVFWTVALALAVMVWLAHQPLPGWMQ